MDREKCAYFLSDLHLGASYSPDARERERKVVAFLDSIKNSAAEIYLLGDILDYWYEYRYVVPRGYTRFFGKIAELADAGIKIVWLKGNHDIWIFDYLPQELGIEIEDGILIRDIMGHKCLLHHGDGVGQLKPSFKLIRGLFRNSLAQRLFSGIHPRWTVPFAYRWSSHSRKGGEKRDVPEDILMKNLREFTAASHQENPEIEYYIFGHVHLLTKEVVADGCEMIILGDWIKHFSYATLTRSGLTLHQFDLQE